VRPVHLLTLAASLLLPATAGASSTVPPVVHFDQGPGVSAALAVYTGGGDYRVELVRGGQVLGQAAWSGERGGRVSVPRLIAGDVARLYAGGALRHVATYDGTPVIEDACAGRSAFSFTRPSLRHEWAAGVLTPRDLPLDGARLLGRDERTDGPLTIPVSLPRPLEVGDSTFAVTRAYVLPEGPEVMTSRTVVVDRCPLSTPVATPRLRDAAAKLRRAPLGRRKQIKLPMTFSEPGTYRVRLVARGGRTLAEGTRTRAGAGRALVTVTVRRRATFARVTRVTLRAVFTPARGDVSPVHAGTVVTLGRARSR
jgi:hypothetical protein